MSKTYYVPPEKPFTLFLYFPRQIYFLVVKSVFWWFKLSIHGKGVEAPLRCGAAALYSTDNGLWIEHAANFKSGKECKYDRHSEQELLSIIQKLGAITCNVLVVAGDIQVDQHSGKETKTLHPCGWCRDAITHNPLITEKTTIVTTRPDLSVVEYGSRDEYLEFHYSGSNTLTLLAAEE